MRILNYFRIEPDLTQLPQNGDVQFSVEDMKYYRQTWNCFDESGLALSALLLKKHPETVCADAAVIQKEPFPAFYRKLYALRFNKVTQVLFPLQYFRPRTEASIIADVFRRGKYDLLLLGQISGVDQLRTVPYLVGQILDLPVLDQVYDVFLQDGNLYAVTMDALQETVYLVDRKVILSVGNCVYSRLPIPTVRDRVKFGDKPVEVLSSDLFCEALLAKEDFNDFSYHPVGTKGIPKEIHAGSPQDAASYIKGFMKDDRG